MAKTLLIATFPMTPSVNDLYVNVAEGTSKRKPNGGRKMKYEYLQLKQHITDSLYNGFFLEGGVGKIHHVDQETVRDIREEYDIAHFRKSKEKPQYTFVIELTFVFTDPRSDGDNRIKFIQDILANWIGANDSQVASVYLEKVVVEKPATPHVIVVFKLTEKTYSATGILENALQALEFERMDFDLAFETIEDSDVYPREDCDDEIDCLEDLEL